MEGDESLRKIAKGGFIVLLGLVISKLLGYAYRVIVARMGAEQYGLISIGIALLGIATTLSVLGLNQGVLRYVSFYKGKEEFSKIKEILVSSFNLIFPLSLVLAVLLFVFSRWLSVNVFNNEELSLVIKIIAIALPFNSIREVLFNTFKAFQKVQYEVYSKNILENVLKVLLTIIFFILGFKLLGATLAFTLSIILSFILAVYYLEKKVFSVLKFKTSKFLNKELLVYSIPLLFSNFIFSLILWTDTLMIGYFLPEAQVGIYNAAQPTAFLMFMLPYALLILFVPILTELYAKHKKEEFRVVYRTVTKWVFGLNLILLSIFYLFSKDILRILFGDNYVTASSSLIVLGTGYFIGYIASTIQSLLLVIKKTKIILFNTVIMAVGNILLNIFLIPKYGIVGAAIATGFIFTIRSVLLTIESISITKIIPFKLNYIKIVFSILVVSAIVKYVARFYEINIFTLILTIIFMVILYGGLLLVTRSFEREDAVVIKFVEDKIGINFTKVNMVLGRFIK